MLVLRVEVQIRNAYGIFCSFSEAWRDWEVCRNDDYVNSKRTIMYVPAKTSLSVAIFSQSKGQ